MVTEPALSVAERSALVAVARRFYLEDRSKVEIADEFGYSRFKVARMLEQARALGVVTITLHDQGTVIPELAHRLVTELGLREAVVVESDGSEAVARQHVAAAAADLLSQTLRDGEILGISWGRTLSAMTETLPSLPSVSVVQLTGTVGSNFEQSPVEIVRKVALNSGGSAHPIFAPMVVDNAATAAALRQQPDVAQAMRMFDDVTTAVLALGSWDPVESQLAEAVPDAQRRELLERGVVAEVAATLIARDGSLVAPDFADQCLAVTADQLRTIPRVLLVAAGDRKATAARAVVRAGLLTGIVTDRVLAEALLADPAAG
ncbi:MAG: sugar-binding domain-containing protein [Rhodoglobus sp.]|jgi:DNA-binding transcriptional regulator LsrR (DeoR family)|nr:sugar-binding domain-containing protein [Rhodoglobus sp.]